MRAGTRGQAPTGSMSAGLSRTPAEPRAVPPPRRSRRLGKCATKGAWPAGEGPRRPSSSPRRVGTCGYNWARFLVYPVEPASSPSHWQLPGSRRRAAWGRAGPALRIAAAEELRAVGQRLRVGSGRIQVPLATGPNGKRLRCLRSAGYIRRPTGARMRLEPLPCGAIAARVGGAAGQVSRQPGSGCGSLSAAEYLPFLKVISKVKSLNPVCGIRVCAGQQPWALQAAGAPRGEAISPFEHPFCCNLEVWRRGKRNPAYCLRPSRTRGRCVISTGTMAPL